MFSETFDVPVAFFVFNRPSLTRLTFEAISKMKPSNLFLIADGARGDVPGENEKVADTIKIIQNITWPCEVKTNFSQVNMGCRDRVSTGISWIFEHVDRVIILEDDCLPTNSFFIFCEQMLNLYQFDRRVYSISGSSFLDDAKESGHTFSRYSLMWGWATWSDRWQEYEIEPKDSFKVIQSTWGFRRPVVLVYWLIMFKNLMADKINTWDFQWMLTVWRVNALTCRPTHNLIKNIGFGSDATHTTNEKSPLGLLRIDDTLRSYQTRLSPIAPNLSFERADENKWAMICIRSILLMMFPWLAQLIKFIRFR